MNVAQASSGKNRATPEGRERTAKADVTASAIRSYVEQITRKPVRIADEDLAAIRVLVIPVS